MGAGGNICTVLLAKRELPRNFFPAAVPAK